MDAAERAVTRAVEYIFSNLHEEVTVEDIARAAMFSKFHFTRVFQRVTGISPGRFLTAVRLQEAKRLLLSTPMSIIQVSHRVGYSSVGTFSAKFSKSVGVPPSVYRSVGGKTDLRCLRESAWSTSKVGSVHGHVRAQHPDELGLVFVGVFPGRIPQGRPVRCAVLHRPGPFHIDHVPQGEWYVLSHSLSADRNEVICAPVDGDTGLVVGSTGPIRVTADTVTAVGDLVLRPKRSIDPPVVLALMYIRSSILADVG
jgi:AraC family transcriptional regulator